MDRRKEFIGKGLGLVAGLAALNSLRAAESGAVYPAGICYSEAQPGRWKEKVKSHAPVVTVKGKVVTIETMHPMTEEHYIVRHTLVSATGEVLGEKTFHSSDAKAISVFTLEGKAGKMVATSFCNKHDLWVREFNLV